MAGLDPSDVVNVQVSLEPAAVPARNFGAAIKVGSTDGIISVAERYRQYADLGEVADDFPLTSPEYLAAAKHFGQSPQPNLMYVGRFAQYSTRAALIGAILTPTQQLLSNFIGVTNGALTIYVGGVPTEAQGVSFLLVANMNGVAYALQQALGGVATVIWNASIQRFEVYSVALGPTATLSFAQAPTAAAHIAYSANPTAGEKDTYNGTAVTYVAAVSGPNQVLIGPSLAGTLLNLIAALNGSTDPGVASFTYDLVGTTLEVAAKAGGAAGNALTLASTAGVASAATLSGGAGTDISSLMGLSAAALALPPVAGVAPETPLACVAAMDNVLKDWYSFEFVLAAPLMVADDEACANYIQGASPSRIYGTTITTTDVLIGGISSDKASILGSLGLGRTYAQYSTSSSYASTSFFARIATVNWDAPGTAITLMFKQEPGVAGEVLTENGAASLKAKHCNVFAVFQNGAVIIKDGMMINGDYVDERVGLDWLQNRVQTDMFNLLLTSPTKIPQTDPGQALLIAQASASMERGVSNGLLAEGIWNGPSFGTLKTGQNLVGGFYCWSDLYANQSQSDRQARKAMPILIAAKLAGAVQEVDVLITVVR